MSNELVVQDPTFLTPSEFTLARELDLTAQNAKVTASKELLAEWFREVAGHPPERITDAFRRWRRQSQFFPAISEILALIERKESYTEKSDREFASWRREVSQGRSRGEVKSFAEWVEVDPELAARFEELKRRIGFQAPARSRVIEMPRRPAPAGVVLSPEEIQKRRAGELEEIRRIEANDNQPTVS